MNNDVHHITEDVLHSHSGQVKTYVSVYSIDCKHKGKLATAVCSVF